jgi:hypothetical protein
MTDYTTSSALARVVWPEPIEQIWQVLPGCSQSSPNWKRPDLGLSERLFIGAVLNLPKDRRRWGIVTWLAGMLNVSRPSLYAIGKRTRKALLPEPALPKLTTDTQQKAASSSNEKTIPLALQIPAEASGTIAITPNRIRRTALALLLPGGVPDRSAEICLQVAFDESRSPAFQSALLHEAGKRAGQILEQVDHSVLGEVVQARDELFVGRDPILLMVEPNSLVITGLYATGDREAETWGCVLLFTQDRRVQIKGLAEDGCIPYDASCKAANLDVAIQKDVWHPLEDVRKVIHDLEREALQALKVAEQLEKKLRKHWDEAVFAEWVKPYEHLENLLAQIDRLSFWHGCLWDAVELVDWRSGEIRERAINQWLAEESLKGINQLQHPRIRKLAERLEKQLPEMLTFLDGIAQPLADWQTQVEQHCYDHSTAACFQSSVARLWRLEHALRNGHTGFRKATVEAQQWLALWIEDDPQLQKLAEKLLTLLERTVRTSCAAETINSVLRPYLTRRRECTDLTSRQLFLNLFVLWFNMHKFERGPRKGKSPYEVAGIDLGTDDWLTLLGYSPD